MLQELKIENLAIIESLHLEFEPGFLAITGETGAGKSILMNALKGLMGAKLKTDIIRNKADNCKITGQFDLPPHSDIEKKLLEWGLIDTDDSADEIILQRELHQNGRSKARMNGTPITLKQLETIGSQLMDLHGQHSQQALLNTNSHLSFIDSFAGLQSDRDNYQHQYSIYQSLHSQKSELLAQNKRVKEQFDFYQYQYNELKKANLKPNEESLIEEELQSQKNHFKINETIQNALSYLQNDGGSLAEQFAGLKRNLDRLQGWKPHEKMKSFMAEAESFTQSLNEIESFLISMPQANALSSQEIDDANARLAFLQKLKSKYKLSVTELITLKDKRHQELLQLKNQEVNLQDIEEKLSKQIDSCFKLAAKLNLSREKAAKKFSKKVNAQLNQLGMSQASFSVAVLPLSPSDTLTSSGIKHLEFMLSANPGEKEKPLAQIASGGESSRIMLSIKSVLAECDPRALLVFDEVDSGIGGETGHQVGKALSELAQSHQIIAITHLHQVASQSDAHFKVAKALRKGRTCTLVEKLSQEDRVSELARMLGDKEGQSAIQHAQELLKASKKHLSE